MVKTFPLIFCLLASMAFAQEPAQPRVAPLPTNIAFTRTYTRPAQAPAESQTEEQKAEARFLERFPKLVEVKLVKTGDIQSETRKFVGGGTWEVWRVNGISFTVASDRPDQISVSAPGMNSGGAGDGESVDFPELSWLPDAQLVTSSNAAEQKFTIYRSGEKTVWLDAATGLPVSLRSPEETITYTYQSPPVTPLVLPEKFGRRLEDVRRAWRGGPNNFSQ